MYYKDQFRAVPAEGKNIPMNLAGENFSCVYDFTYGQAFL